MALSSSGDVARGSDRKRTEVYNISQVMQLLADSSDDSGSDLNLSDLDIGGNSSASECDVEGATFQHQRRLSQHFRQQVMACHLYYNYIYI